MTDVRAMVGEVAGFAESWYRYAEHDGVRERAGVSGADMYGFVRAACVMLERMVHAGAGSEDEQRQMSSVYRSAMSRWESLRPAGVDLNEEGEISPCWYERNREAVGEFFLNCMRVRRVVDVEYRTRRLVRPRR